MPTCGEFKTGGAAQAVALFLAEDSEQSARARLAALAKGRGLDPEKALEKVFLECRATLNLRDAESVANLIASIRLLPEKPGLVVLDPLRDLHDAEEKESGPMAEVMGNLRAIRDLCGCGEVHAAPGHRRLAMDPTCREGDLDGQSAIQRGEGGRGE
jgi:hypothetical protein